MTKFDDAAYHLRAPERPIPFWVRLIGGNYYDGGSVRTPWGEFTPRRFGLSVRIGCYDWAHLHIALFFFSVFIKLPFLTRALQTGYCSIENPSYGFALHATDIFLNWGRKTKIVYLPWQARYLFREFLSASGEWLPHDQRARSWAPGVGVEPLTVQHPYHYLLNGGETQHVTATVVRERDWKVWVWFGDSGPRHKAPVSDFLRSMQRRLSRPIEGIDITFSDEVGERAGSWKGGCVGCSWTMKPGESVAAALQRMQRERRFRRPEDHPQQGVAA